MSTKPLLLLFLGIAGLACAGTSIAACVGDDGVPPDTTAADGGAEASPTTTPPATLKANGTTCTVANQCTSGICADGVCCDQTCDGICEKCSLSGTVGVCTAIPLGQDPDLECPTIPLPSDTVTDAGTPTDAGDAGADDGGDAGDDDAAVVDAGPQFNVPEAGLPTTNAPQCAGSCNGKRACAFPDSTTQCGTAFCGDSTEEGVASCDSAGHCLFGIQECSAYTCPNGAPGCKTSCAADTDCLTGYYCDPGSHTCLQKLANGTACTTLTQCQSTVCEDSVCCNVDCSSTPGGTCKNPSNVGTCVCDACPTGACGLFYPDVDGDTYGDVTATAQNGHAVYGCLGGTPPTIGGVTYVANNKDCLDSNAPIASQVHPGQGDYFTTAYTNGQGLPSFDYDCSGVEDKETPDGENTCYTCVASDVVEKALPIGPVRSVCHSYTTCGSIGQAAGHSCGAGCVANNAAVFYTTVACGQPGYLSSCNSCTSTTSGPSPTYANTQTKMACH